MNIAWQTEPVEASIGYNAWSRLAFTPSGQAGIAYYSSEKNRLQLAMLNSNGTWSISIVEGELNSNPFCSLKFRFDQPAISYSVAEFQNKVKYAQLRGSIPWDIVQVAATSPHGHGGTSLAIGPSHRPAISFFDFDKGLGFAQAGANTSVWTGSIVDATKGAGGDNSLAFDASGHPAIAYVVPNGGHYMIKYAAFDGVNWNIETVGPGSGWCTLAFGPSGEPAISYAGEPITRYIVMFATRSGGIWTTRAVAERAHSPSLAFTPSREPAISYYDSRNLTFAVLSGSTWTNFPVEVGDFMLTSLAFNPVTGQPAISYFDNSQGAVNYAVGTVI